METAVLKAAKLLTLPKEEKEKIVLQRNLEDSELELKRGIEDGERKLQNLVGEEDDLVVRFVKKGDVNILLQHRANERAVLDDINFLKKIMEERY